MTAQRADPVVMEQWAKYTHELGTRFAVYARGLDMLLNADGIWLSRGFAATLAAAEGSA
jgi:hypothetical protein